MEKTALRYDAQITQVGVAFIVAGKVPRLERPRQRFARRLVGRQQRMSHEMGFALKGVKTAAERNTGVCFHLPHFGGTAVRDHPECAAHITGVHHPLRRNVLPRGRQYEGAVLFEKLAQDLQAFFICRHNASLSPDG